MNGEIVPKDEDLGIKVLEDCAKLGNDDASAHLGLYYFDKNKKETNALAYKYLNIGYKKKPIYSLRCASCLGVLYLLGRDITKDIDKAIKLFEESISFEMSKFYLGYCYYNGIGYQKDDKKALELFKECHLKRFNLGGVYYGYFLYSGIGTETNKVEAFNVLKNYENDEKILNEYPVISYIVGRLYYLGKSGKVDYESALKYFNYGYEKFGFPKSSFYAGMMYYRGMGTKKDYSKSFPRLKKAYEKGNKDSIPYLAESYKYGKGTDKDLDKCYKLLLEGYNNGDKSSKIDLGIMYFKGESVPKNINKAYEFLKDIDSISAKYYVALCYFEDSFYLRNNEIGIKKLLELAYKKNTEILNKLGSIFYEGKVVTKDIPRAFEYYRMSADLGDRFALCFIANRYLGYEHKYRNYELGYKYAKIGHDKGIFYSTNLLAWCYYMGYVVKKDFKKAYELFSMTNNKYDQGKYTYFGLLARQYLKCAKDFFNYFFEFKNKFKTIIINNKTYYTNDSLIFNNFYFCVDGNNIYFGMLQNNELNKKCLAYYSDYGYFSGELVNLLPSGSGKLMYPNGALYEGDFLDIKPNGFGELTFTNGNSFRGSFLNGHIDSTKIGCLKDVSGKETFGYFEDLKIYEVPLKIRSYEYIEDDSSDYSSSESNDIYEDSSNDSSYDYYEYDDDPPYSYGTETLVDDDDGNTFDIFTGGGSSGRDSDGNLWESDGPYSDHYHMVDEDDD